MNVWADAVARPLHAFTPGTFWLKSCYDGERRGVRTEVQGQCDRTNQNLFRQNDQSQHLPLPYNRPSGPSWHQDTARETLAGQIRVCVGMQCTCGLCVDFYLSKDWVFQPANWGHAQCQETMAWPVWTYCVWLGAKAMLRINLKFGYSVLCQKPIIWDF